MIAYVPFAPRPALNGHDRIGPFGWRSAASRMAAPRPYGSPSWRCGRCDADAELRLAILRGEGDGGDLADLAGLPRECHGCTQWERTRWRAIERLAGGEPPDLAPRAADAPPSVCIAKLEAKPVDWLWRDYIPAGMLTLIDGDPGLGKSFLTIDLAARVSRGLPMPPHGGAPIAEPAGVLLCNAEDDPARTIRPRLEAAGADLQRVHLPDVRAAEGQARPVVLPDDLPELETIIVAHGVRLVVIDPFMAFLAGAVDSHKDSDIRHVLHRLKDMAERTRAAIVIVRHLNKMVSVGDPMYRGGGSIGIIGAARSAFLIGRRPQEDGHRVLARVKGNLCPEPPALAFRIGEGRLGWIGETDLRAEDLLARRSSPGRPADAIEEAKTFLADALAAGERLARDVEAEAERQGISGRTLERAKRDLGIIAIRPVSSGGPWGWRLPGEAAKTTPAGPTHNFGGVDSPAPNPMKNKGIRATGGESAKMPSGQGDSGGVPSQPKPRRMRRATR